MDKLSLDFLDETARLLVINMLSAVADHSDIHVNAFTIRRNQAGNVEYFVGLHKAGTATPFPQYSQLPIDIVPQLRFYGFAESDNSPGRPPGWYRFTDEALDSYRRSKDAHLDNEEVHALPGFFMFELLKGQTTRATTCVWICHLTNCKSACLPHIDLERLLPSVE